MMEMADRMSAFHPSSQAFKRSWTTERMTRPIMPSTTTETQKTIAIIDEVLALLDEDTDFIVDSR